MRCIRGLARPGNFTGLLSASSLAARWAWVRSAHRAASHGRAASRGGRGHSAPAATVRWRRSPRPTTSHARGLTARSLARIGTHPRAASAARSHQPPATSHQPPATSVPALSRGRFRAPTLGARTGGEGCVATPAGREAGETGVRRRRAAPQASPGLTATGHRPGTLGPAAPGCERVAPLNPRLAR